MDTRLLGPAKKWTVEMKWTVQSKSRSRTLNTKVIFIGAHFKSERDCYLILLFLAGNYYLDLNTCFSQHEGTNCMKVFLTNKSLS